MKFKEYIGYYDKNAKDNESLNGYDSNNKNKNKDKSMKKF